MHFSITHVTKVGTKLVPTKNEALNLDSLTIGSGRDQNLCLNDVYVLKHHAEITSHKNKVFIIATDSINTGGIAVNNVLVQKQRLKKGDVLNFGSFEATVLELPSKAIPELQLQVEKKTGGVSATRALPSRASLRLDDTWLKKRSWSLKSFFFILLFFLLIPVVSFFMPSKISEQLRSLPMIPSDHSWDTGQLAHKDLAHHQSEEEHTGNDKHHDDSKDIGKDGKSCNVCHQRAFVMVEDSSCAQSSCHETTQEHINPELYEKNNLLEKRCATCHKEHNGIENHLVDSNDSLCSSCHHGITKDGTTNQAARNIADLDHSHPEFLASVSKFNKDKMAFYIERQSLQDRDIIQEKSNLSFPHDKHLIHKGIDNKSTGKIVKMECDNCHTLTLSGENFEPITRKKHCQECHLLTFEPDSQDDLEKQVVHGDVDKVLEFLTGYYSDRALKGKEKKAPLPERYRPGSTVLSDKKLNDEEQKVVREWVDKKVKQVSDELFLSTTCTGCHQVIDHRGKKGSKKDWEILPVNITTSWFPRAKLFNHKKHRHEACTSCHNSPAKNTKVETSDKKVSVSTDEPDVVIAKGDTQLASANSSDVLMPKLKKCKECHSSEDPPNKYKTACVVCHGFHTHNKYLMGVKEKSNDKD